MIPLPPRPTWEAVCVFIVVFVGASAFLTLLGLATLGALHLLGKL